ncbi:MAG: hypothetical protein A3B15_01165 [Candidatus Buchananbacteria bacterium RIFCSPLOWO2_01_FULL_45_31]|uniref:Reverse transcriptase domain-containing protein n=1 Tax=Candidatus Buchananbacteria bacterium RIFCSPLOWO2_01_FULL_45_31 TaxID=1797545 RepID=A0A1G1YR91_9BACT|nr:MAG: hypothetical protein A3B15_01165 [Candidatus Buchananbacteria bacterium RIFCSPLOWO2_01_FULL_45_31]
MKLNHTFNEIISLDNLLLAWWEFIDGKRNKRDVQNFQFRLMDNIISLRHDLAIGAYRHGGYRAFNVSDPKPRNIHKASVRDRLVHHAIYRILYPFFDRTFIADSYSCRLGKGNHKALNRFRQFAYKTSKNNTHACWVLKGDIRKFFASINHDILANILKQRIEDDKVAWLLNEIIGSFSANNAPGIGLPLGNLTSQLLANIYMNEFDQFIKHQLKIKHYIRYSDDFCVLADNKIYLERLIKPIETFLSNKLKLTLHPDKIFIKTLASGMDFLGWVHFPDHRVLRTTTKKRMFKRIGKNPKPETINSYLGLLSHGNAYKSRQKVVKALNLRK